MQCKNHPDRKAEHLCSACNAPLCNDCVEEIRPGEYFCFQCAMLQSVSQVGSSLAEKKDKASKDKGKERKWTPFHYFLTVASVLIAVMWVVIIFGGEPPPQQTAQFTKEGRVFLFMVDGALKRYAHYEGSKYPEKLDDLVPKYLALKDSEIILLKKFSYEKGADIGYRLSMANPTEGEMNPILSPKGVEYMPAPREGA